MATKFNDIMGYNLPYITGFCDSVIRCSQSKFVTADREWPLAFTTW